MRGMGSTRRRMSVRVMGGLSALASALFLLCLTPGGAGATGAAPALTAHGSVEQVYATGIAPGAKVTLYGPGGQAVQKKNADELGGILFREVAPGPGYEIGIGGERS